MPWTVADVDKHKKDLTPEQKKKWISIANSVLKDSGDEGKAIRIANSKCVEAIQKVYRKRGGGRPTGRPTGRPVDLATSFPTSFSMFYDANGILKSIIVPGRGEIPVWQDEEGEYHTGKKPQSVSDVANELIGDR